VVTWNPGLHSRSKQSEMKFLDTTLFGTSVVAGLHRAANFNQTLPIFLRYSRSYALELQAIVKYGQGIFQETEGSFHIMLFWIGAMVKY